MKKHAIAAVLLVAFPALAEQITDVELTGQRVYHHMENVLEHIELHGLNSFAHEPIADHTFFVITPALDHLYSKAMLDLRTGPVEIDIPPRDERYASIQLKDAQHFTIFAESMPQEGGKYLIYRNGAGYALPEGDYVEVIGVNDDLIFAFLRTQTFEYRDSGAADGIRQQYQIHALGEETGFEAPNREDVKAVLKLAHTISDGHSQTNEWLEMAIASFDIFEYQKTASHVMNMAISGKITDNRSGFEYPGHRDDLGRNDIRSVATHVGHLGLPAYHAYYEVISMNPNGEVLNGREDFTVTLPHNQAVDEFWSITRYSSATRLPLNPEYIGGSTQQVFGLYNTNPDDEGNVTITFSSENPENGTYWMPVINDEDYYFVIRYYGPQPELTGKTLKTQLYQGTPLEAQLNAKPSF